MKTRMNIEAARVIKNGIEPRNMVPRDTSGYKLCIAYASIAKGGLSDPVIIAATHNTPKCKGLKPSANTTGKNTGNVITITANISMKIPIIM